MALLLLCPKQEESLWTLAILIFLLALAAWMAGRLGRVWLKYRGDRVVTCPETKQTVGVALDVKHAAWSGLGHAPSLRLETCSRWPERQDCGQECLRQIEESPEDCLVRTILTKWYAGKSCAICGNPIGEIHWADHRPGLLSPERRTVEWTQVRPEDHPRRAGNACSPSVGTATSSRPSAGSTPTWWWIDRDPARL